MRIVGTLLIIWLLIGAFAAFQRGYSAVRLTRAPRPAPWR